MTKRWRYCVSVVASRKVNFIVLRVRNALFIIGTIRGVTSGERFKKNFYCGVYEVISLGKWPSSYDCIVPLADQGMGGIGIGDPLPVSKKIF